MRAVLHGLLLRPPGIYLTERNPPGLGRCAFGARDVGLELHRAGACRRHGVDIGVGRAQAAVVRLGDLRDDEARGRHGFRR